MTGLYQKHRPKTLDELVGQPEAVKIIKGWLKNGGLPHAILLTGSSGCGKTTIARILKRELGCKNADFNELNSADFRGIDSIREIRSKMHLSPIGKCRIYLLDECHKITSEGQHSMLKMLEDTPAHVYFMLATTDPHKLLKTIVTRCSEIKVRSLSATGLSLLINKIAEKEGKQLTEDLVDKIADAADGSARKALVILHSILSIEGEDEQLEAVSKSDAKADAVEIARTLVNPRVTWGEMSKVLKKVDLDDYEGLRYLVLAYCKNVMLGGGGLAARAAMIIDFFKEPFYDSKQAGFCFSCWEAVHTKV